MSRSCSPSKSQYKRSLPRQPKGGELKPLTYDGYTERLDMQSEWDDESQEANHGHVYENANPLAVGEISGSVQMFSWWPREAKNATCPISSQVGLHRKKRPTP